MKIFFIVIFGILGVLARYFTEQIIPRKTNGFPVSIFFINMIGCLMIGVAFALVQKKLLGDPNLETAVIVGFLGGLTTFSSFSLDLFKFIFISENYLLGFTYFILSPTVGLILTWLGFTATSKFTS